MSEIQVMKFAGGTQQEYDAVSHQIGLDTPGAQWPDGLRQHFAGPTDNGGWCVVDEWESREDFQRFFESRLRPAFEQVGMQQPESTWFRVYNQYDQQSGAR